MVMRTNLTKQSRAHLTMSWTLDSKNIAGGEEPPTASGVGRGVLFSVSRSLPHLCRHGDGGSVSPLGLLFGEISCFRLSWRSGKWDGMGCHYYYYYCHC